MLFRDAILTLLYPKWRHLVCGGVAPFIVLVTTQYNLSFDSNHPGEELLKLLLVDAKPSLSHSLISLLLPYYSLIISLLFIIKIGCYLRVHPRNWLVLRCKSPLICGLHVVWIYCICLIYWIYWIYNSIQKNTVIIVTELTELITWLLTHWDDTYINFCLP